MVAHSSVTPARPDLSAHRQSLSLEFSELVSGLITLVGRKLTAYVANVKDVRTVESWARGAMPYGEVEARLRLTFQIVRMLSDHDSPRVVQAWLTGVNPELGDRVPVRLLREGEISAIAPEVLGAARAFIAGG